MDNPFPKNSPFSCWTWTPSFIDSMGRSEPIVQTASRSVQMFSHMSPQSVPILYNGQPLPLQNCPLFMGDMDPTLIYGFSGTRVLNPNDISIGSAVFAGLTSVTDRQTDRPRYSVGN